MTREREIERHGTIYSDIPSNYIEWSDGWQDYDDQVYVERAFIEGAKWADNNPKEGLVSIDKVCEWLENNVNNYIIIDDYLGKVQPKISSNMFDNFKKAMES